MLQDFRFWRSLLCHSRQVWCTTARKQTEVFGWRIARNIPDPAFSIEVLAWCWREWQRKSFYKLSWDGSACHNQITQTITKKKDISLKATKVKTQTGTGSEFRGSPNIVKAKTSWSFQSIFESWPVWTNCPAAMTPTNTIFYKFLKIVSVWIFFETKQTKQDWKTPSLKSFISALRHKNRPTTQQPAVKHAANSSRHGPTNKTTSSSRLRFERRLPVSLRSFFVNFFFFFLKFSPEWWMTDSNPWLCTRHPETFRARYPSACLGLHGGAHLALLSAAVMWGRKQ